MGRKVKYQTADDLLDNTTVRNDCLVWPESSCLMPSLGPASPMAVRFGTTSVIRVLFTICRYPPAGPRLVGLCSTRFCVNPYHYAEAKRFRKQRKDMLDPHGLLPCQETRRHLVAPPDDYIALIYPRKPEHVRFLAETAARAGLDGKGLRASDRRTYNGFPMGHPATVNMVYADPAKPIFKLKSRTPNTAISICTDTTNSDELVELKTPDLDLKELTKTLGPTHAPIDQSQHPDDFGRDEITRKRLTLHSLLEGLNK